LHLELQNSIKPLFGLEQTAEAAELQPHSSDLLRGLLVGKNRSDNR
jgi:hypothetical protein